MIWSTYPSLKNSCCWCFPPTHSAFALPPLRRAVPTGRWVKRFWRNQRRWRARSRTSAPITRWLACVASGGYAGIVPQSVLDTLTLPEASQLRPVGQAITQLIWRKGYASPALEKMRQLLESASDL
ncbi:transcriptional regulator [Klebsiella michiganensis]|uniref:Transcriptional regulator n=1 Tax=Klebsiella michiganensis TaxID=1134687 RepID=A0A7H4MYV3_9ENTR|nr:transcriptional regulator [Klebsiella michiganensis]